MFVGQYCLFLQSHESWVDRHSPKVRHVLLINTPYLNGFDFAIRLQTHKPLTVP